MRSAALAVIFGSSALLTAMSGAQSLQPDFTRDELYKVTRFFLREPEALEIVDSMYGKSTVQVPVRATPHINDKALPGEAGKAWIKFEGVGGITYTDDMLILLSLISPETDEKVNTYRRNSRGQSGITREEETEWQARRIAVKSLPEVRKWLDEIVR